MAAAAGAATTSWEEVRGLLQQLVLLCSSSGAGVGAGLGGAGGAGGAGASSADTLRLLASSRGELREVMASAQTGAKKVIHDLSRAVVSPARPCAARTARDRHPPVWPWRAR